MGAQADDPAEKNFDSLANKNEKPVHQVKLSDYYIGETVVTQALWEAVMGSNHANVKGDNLPMVQITYDDCEGFIKKLNQLTGAKFRLPTEAEWEYAARGGGMSRGFMFSGGNNLDDVAWYYYNSDTIPHPVKTKRGNELGLYDMTGNVWEICSDWYGLYGSAMQENPTGPAHGDSVVIRGGSWYSKSAKSLRLTYRYMDIKKNYYSNQGFRLVMEVPLYTEKDSADGLHCVLNGVPFVMKAVIGGYAYLGAQSTKQKITTKMRVPTSLLCIMSKFRTSILGRQRSRRRFGRRLWGITPHTARGRTCRWSVFPQKILRKNSCPN